MRWFQGLGLLGFGMLAVAMSTSCSDTASGKKPSDQATCTAGLSCCEPGYTGFTECVDGVELCNCQPIDSGNAGTTGGSGICPELKPAAEPTFAACGGEPFGLWQATDVQLGPSFSSIDVLDTLTIGGGDCPMLPAHATVPNFLLDLASGGVAAYAFGDWSFDYQWSSACSDYRKSPCIQPFPNEISCTCKDTDATCGVSSCTADVPSTYGGTTHGGGSWTRSGSTISIANVTSFDYCVQANMMQINWGGAVYTMKQVQAGGVPTPCSSRSAADCTASADCHPLCSGGTDCATAASEAQCTNRQGCTWDTSQCAGTAATTCDLQDYGIVPGCNVLTTAAKCVGSAAPCAGKAEAACGKTPGCNWGEGCVGGALTCGDAFDCTGCNAAPGCACNQDGTCLGTSSFDCTIFDHLETCQAWGKDLELCSWANATCNGKPTQCSDLALFDCPNTPGCQIQGN